MKEHEFNKLFLDTEYTVEWRDLFAASNEKGNYDAVKDRLNGSTSREIIEVFLGDAPGSGLEIYPVGDNVDTMKRLLVRYYTHKKIKKRDRILLLISEKNRSIIDYIKNELKFPHTIL